MRQIPMQDKDGVTAIRSENAAIAQLFGSKVAASNLPAGSHVKFCGYIPDETKSVWIALNDQG